MLTLFLLALLLTPLAAAGEKPLKVVATVEDLADIVREVGGERVEVFTICRGRENLHRVMTRPSHLAGMARADVFVQYGLSLEMSFVPGLMQACRNRDIQPGMPGFINVSEGWEAIQVPEVMSRAAGDIHPQGNPHMNLDPRAGRHVAGRVLAGLVSFDPSSRELYERRHADYLERLERAEARWNEQAAGWKGARAVVYHQEFDYLMARYGIEKFGAIEVKPGIPPTPRHVAELIDRMRKDKPDAILTAPWSNNQVSERIAKETGVPIVELPNMAGEKADAQTWIGMMDLVHGRLARVLPKKAEAK